METTKRGEEKRRRSDEKELHLTISLPERKRKRIKGGKTTNLVGEKKKARLDSFQEVLR